MRSELFDRNAPKRTHADTARTTAPDALARRLTNTVLDQLLATPGLGHRITAENREAVGSVVHTATIACLATLEIGSPGPSASRHATTIPYQLEPELLTRVANSMARHIWRGVADVALTCGASSESLASAADALFSHLCDQRRHSPNGTLYHLAHRRPRRTFDNS